MNIMNNKTTATAKQEKSIVNIIKKRITTTAKQSNIKLSKLANDQLNSCKTQAKLIDFAIRLNLNHNEIVDKLVELQLCATTATATARIKRHKQSDIESRIIKRNVIDISHNKLASDI